MAYNLTRHSVIRNKPQLEQILKSKGAVRFWTNKPRELQRNLHEAIRAAGEFSEYRHFYEQIKPNYTIKVKKDHVLVERKETVIVHRTEVQRDLDFVELPAGTKEVVTESGLVLQSFPIEPRQEVSDASTLPEILLVAKNAGDEVTDLVFPQASLNRDEKKALSAWCLVRKINFIDQEEKGLTLTRREVDQELIWREDDSNESK